MMYARTGDGRVEAAPGLAGACPSCGSPVRPKCGSIVVHHWAHLARADCDPWTEPEGEWHRGWKLAVPPERREVVIGPHRADIVTASGGVVELQHSPISPEVITEREEFYGDRMAWIFDARSAHISITAGEPVLVNTPCGCCAAGCARIWLRPGTECRCLHDGCTGVMAERQWAPARYVEFSWKRPRRSVTTCRRLVLLDIGGEVILRVAGLTLSGTGTGVPYTRSSVEAWLREGASWDRLGAAMVPEPGESYYWPPGFQAVRDPAGWRAAQEELRRSVFR